MILRNFNVYVEDGGFFVGFDNLNIRGNNKKLGCTYAIKLYQY